jgi:phosphoglycerate dehydrogenase-like enzyme
VRAVFVDADDTLAAIARALRREGDPPVAINRDPDVAPEAFAAVLGDAEITIIDHTPLPTRLASQCRGLAHVVFLGTGARSYMNPEELAGLGITVHIIKGYGDTAVAECAIALMWAAARGLARMDRGMRAGRWLGVILVNTARGALVDAEAMIEALRSGHIRHAGLDVFAIEPLPAGHILTTLNDVTLSAHSGFRTPEASENLIGAALDHCRRIAATGR